LTGIGMLSGKTKICLMALKNFNVVVPTFNRVSSNSDENEISLYTITTCSNIQVMRIKKVITKDKMS